MSFMTGKKRILILGSSGAGKSTLARALGEATGLPVVHLDRLWWLPGWENRSREEFDCLLEQELSRESWIMDGNYARTLPQRLARAQGVVLLEPGRLRCEMGILHRVLNGGRAVRQDMAPGCPERLDLSFLRWVWNFPAQDGAATAALLEQYRQVPVLRLNSRRQANRFLKEVQEDGRIQDGCGHRHGGN